MSGEEKTEKVVKTKPIACLYCGGVMHLDAKEWASVKRLPWCGGLQCYAEVWDAAERPVTREGLYETYCKKMPKELIRQDRLLVELSLAVPCHCNNCGG